MHLSFNHLLVALISALFTLGFSISESVAQRAGYWQQEVHYEMDVDMHVEANQFDGKQKLVYTNNSPDTLNRVFYHLFFNAFQPNSMMDKRSRTIADPSSKIADKITGYDSTEIGYQKISSLKQNGEEVEFLVEGTILEVQLKEPILPGGETVFEMEFNAQVPLQTRRSGRDNEEGVRFSMSQWYPKIAAYDEDGWHPNPYIGREFYAPFGVFDVTIHIDSSYVVAAGSVLQNPEEVGFGYETEGMEVNRPDGEKLTWHFRSENVHDFMWAADPDFTQITNQVQDGPLLRFFHQTGPVAENASEERAKELPESWANLPAFTAKAVEYMNKNVGKYPYKEYSVIQGGDGGMEYIMGTLITGNRSFRSLVGVTVHELIHSWFHGVLANNEVYEAWIDEGFTSYFSSLTMNEIFDEDEEFPMASQYRGYKQIAVSPGLEEPMSIHSDHYNTNVAYSRASYTKGALFLHQLGYIIGEDVLVQSLKDFYEIWRFKHPTGKDFIRIAEEESGMVLDWYYEYWINTTKTIDYSIELVEAAGDGTNISLKRMGLMPMPIEVEVTRTDSSSTVYYMPLQIMWGEKQDEYSGKEWIQKEDWQWVSPEYTLMIDEPMEFIQKIEIDPTQRMMDINRENNIWEPSEEEFEEIESD
ncbi:M1 family metallopeptidase [Rhodohalobacter sp. 614A]|uniref:M1 family metallopeptidase n=1 Tax=Rhodohalobacter sp. 614A TaxID=2908649 RepID=UPI001F36D834|nr:M1 family metallopeptidase [Rhodohalobacter sp. 614A]